MKISSIKIYKKNYFKLKSLKNINYELMSEYVFLIFSILVS